MDLTYILGGTTITILACAATYFWVKYAAYKSAFTKQLLATNDFKDKYAGEQDKYNKLLSQKKSSETRLGQIGENLVPFLSGCPYNPKDMHFMGNPTDYLVFDFDQGKIVFLEIKTGNSRASKRQKTVKNMVQQGRVFYEELRINEKGIKTKKARNT